MARKQHPTSPRVALVYDKLVSDFGGAEHVLQALHQIYPHAPLFTTVRDVSRTHWLGDWKVHTSFLQRIPGAARFYKVLTPLMPLAIESLDLTEFDIVISVASDHAKGVLTTPNQLHVCYLLTPTRYLYSHTKTYEKTEGMLAIPGIRLLTKPLFAYLRRFDQMSAFRPDVLIPISQNVAKRSEKYYQRTTLTPVYPPLPTAVVSSDLEKTLHVPPSFVLSASRLVAYKRIDLAILAALELQQTLIICGTGPAREKLLQVAGISKIERQSDESLSALFTRAATERKLIIFAGYVSEEELATLYANARAFILPGIEDFGIAPLQAAAHGTPSVLHQDSGVSELFPEPLSRQIATLTPSAVAAALQKILDNPPLRSDLKAVARQHSTERFTTQFSKVVYDLFIQKTESQAS